MRTEFSMCCALFCLVLRVCCMAVACVFCLFCRTMSNIGIACREVVGRSQPPESTNVQIMVDDLRHRWQVVLAELTTRRDKWVHLLGSVLQTLNKHFLCRICHCNITKLVVHNFKGFWVVNFRRLTYMLQMLSAYKRWAQAVSVRYEGFCWE